MHSTYIYQSLLQKEILTPKIYEAGTLEQATL